MIDFAAYAVIFLAIGAGALSKGATGMGMPLIAIPFIAAIFGLQHAVVVLVVPILVSNLWQVWRLRGERTDPRMGFLVPMVATIVIGVAAGVWVLKSLPERALMIGLGIMLIGYLVFKLVRPHVIIGPDTAKRWAAPAGLGAGLLQGAAGISAPIGVTFIHSMGFARAPYVFAVSTMFLAMAVTQVPTLWIAGLLRPEWVLQGVFALIPIAIFMPIGQWLAAKLSQKAFDNLILAFLGIMGLKMIAGI